MKENLKQYSISSLRDVLSSMGYEPYRAEQIFKWLWQKNAKDFSVMTNLSKDARKSLEQTCTISGLQIEKTIPAPDGSKKFLFQTEAEKKIEAVFIPEGRRTTVCVSTQIGCALECRFCATGLMGFKGQLKAYEIADEIRSIQESTQEKLTNIVFMGMGEPLLNLDEVLGAIDIISSPIGLSISQRRTTISTVGILQGIEAFLKSGTKAKLAISLNFADEEMRKEMMPIARKNPMPELLKLARQYSQGRDMITFEYVLIDGLNDRIRDAKQLLRILKGIRSKINLIAYNPHPLLPYKRPSEKRVQEFYAYLLTSHHTITLRKSRGQEICAGCGQLAIMQEH